MADLATAVAKLAEVLEKYYPVFEQYVRINQQNITAKTGQDQQMKEETKSSEEGEKQDSKGFFGTLYDTITSVGSWLYRQEQSEYSRMTTLDPVKSGESEIKELSKYGYVIPDEQMQQIQGQVRNQQEVTKKNIDNYDKGVTRGIAHDMERRKDKFIQETSQDVQEFLQNSTAKEAISSFNDEIRRSINGMDDILRASAIHNVNHLGE